ncbi:hypothetical protein B0H34DRAFT_671943 [Crassisporium funariophilum]|nr:hypothetical protein B0H34DRAFT_671943 [Crassisporium funariophilum]
MSRRPTPTTPFIPPLPSPESSPQPQHTPVIPTSGGNPNWNYPSPSGGSGGYPVYPAASPYVNTTPFIPQLSPMVSPGVIPGGLSPGPPQGMTPERLRLNRQMGLSDDYTGYPNGTPYTSPSMLPPPQLQQQTPLSGGMNRGGYGPAPPSPWYPQQQPLSAPAHYTPWQPASAVLPSAPWGALPASAGPPSTPWGAPPASAALPSTSWGALPASAALPNTPWGAPQQRLPPQAQQAFTPYSPFANFGGGAPFGHMGMGGGPPPLAPQMHGAPPGWGGGPPQQYYPAPDPSPWLAQGAQGSYFNQPPQRAPPEPPSQFSDRMDPFTEGNHYGPVLDPFLVRVVRATVKINPLIQPLPEDGSDQTHLKWNMLFPTSTVQRSTDPSHVSWSRGRDAPATFPRISAMRLVSDTIPWMIDVRARDKDRGVTCGEVIDSIGYELSKFTKQEDFAVLHPRDRSELTKSYQHNRSRQPGVPGGQLGQGMKRLDFLKRNTMFSGVEYNERIVKRCCGDVMPCVFVLKCAMTFQMTAKEVKEHEARQRAGEREHMATSGSRSASKGARSRASSSAARERVTVNVVSPSITSDDSGDADRGSDDEDTRHR